METGRVINRRYLLQRLIKQGRVCAVYQGTDQVLQRTVAVKVVPAQHVAVYRAAIRMTSHFSHPNVIGLYDLIAEAETLYVVQEYVEGDDFSTLLQTQLSPYEVADFGCQLCQALLYASGSSRKVCHGDLTPTAVLRDRHGTVRVNNFALPSDLYYFESWAEAGNPETVVSDKELPWGHLTEARDADDTRAVGLLLYQLLAGRPAVASKVDPPVDGHLRFLRGTPPELCETIARAIIQSHPEHINTAEELYSALKSQAEVLEPGVSEAVAASRFMVGDSYQSQPQPIELARPRQFSPAVAPRFSDGVAEPDEARGTEGDQGVASPRTGTRPPHPSAPPPIPTAAPVATALPARESGNTGLRLHAYRADGNIEPGVLESPHDAPTTFAEVSVGQAQGPHLYHPSPLVPTDQQADLSLESETRRSPILLLLMLGLLLFVLFFVVGYFGGRLLFVH